jgi:hypothetical protein
MKNWGVQHCCKCRPVFWCIRTKSTKQGKFYMFQSYCDGCLPFDIKGHSNVESLTHEEWIKRIDVLGDGDYQ